MHPVRLFALAVALIVLPAARADVAVWRGQGVQTSNILAVKGRFKVTIYYVLDLETFKARVLVANPTTKHVYDEGERGYGLNSYTPATKDFFFLTDVIESSPQLSPVEFTHQIAHVSGKASKVFLGPGNTVEVELPKALKFWLSETIGALLVATGCVVEGQVLFQAGRTQAANSVDKTILQVSQDIRSELITGKGYAEIVAP